MIGRLKELLFQNRGTRQTVTKNIFWLGFGQIAGRLIRATIIIYAARILGAAEYGVFSYALSLAAFFTTFADIGVNSILAREVSREPEKDTDYFATAFWIKIILVSVSAAAVVFLAPYFSKIESAKILMPFIALLVIFDNMRDFSLAFFRAKEKMELEALVTIIMNVAIALSGFVILYYFITAKALTISYVASSGLGLAMALIILRKQVLKIISRFDKNLLKPIVKSAIPIALISTFSIFMINIDIIIIGRFQGAEGVGLYSAAQKIVQLLSILPAILASSVFPATSRLIGQKESEKVRLITEKTMTAALLIAIPLAVGGITLGKPIIGFLYGAEYLSATTSFQILIITLLSIYLAPMASNLVMAYDLQKKAIGYTALASALNVFLDVILIKIYGIAGAAVATLAVSFFFNFSVLKIAKQANNFYILRYLKKIAAAAAVMGIAAFLFDKIGVQVIANIVLSGGIYLLMLYAFKENTLEEIRLLLRAVKT